MSGVLFFKGLTLQKQATGTPLQPADADTGKAVKHLLLSGRGSVVVQAVVNCSGDLGGSTEKIDQT